LPDLFENLASLEVDLIHAYRPLGCCRGLDVSRDCVMDGEEVRKLEVSIRGLRNEAEVQMAFATWTKWIC